MSETHRASLWRSNVVGRCLVIEVLERLYELYLKFCEVNHVEGLGVNQWTAPPELHRKHQRALVILLKVFFGGHQNVPRASYLRFYEVNQCNITKWINIHYDTYIKRHQRQTLSHQRSWLECNTRYNVIHSWAYNGLFCAHYCESYTEPHRELLNLFEWNCIKMK